MTTIPVLPPPRTMTALPDYIQADGELREAAQQLEATFLAEISRCRRTARFVWRGDRRRTVFVFPT